jgi:hypothetical protein
VIEYLKGVDFLPKPAPEKHPLDQIALDQVVEALESAGLMNPDFKPAMVRVEAGALPAASELGGTEVAAFQIGKYEVTYGVSPVTPLHRKNWRSALRGIPFLPPLLHPIQKLAGRQHLHAPAQFLRKVATISCHQMHAGLASYFQEASIVRVRQPIHDPRANMPFRIRLDEIHDQVFLKIRKIFPELPPRENSVIFRHDPLIHLELNFPRPQEIQNSPWGIARRQQPRNQNIRVQNQPHDRVAR